MIKGGAMIYSKDTERICGLCVYAKTDGDRVECGKYRRKKALEITSEGCRKFSYDIFKKTVRRKKPLRADFDPEAFTL